jgi:hypothetical protein
MPSSLRSRGGTTSKSFSNANNEKKDSELEKYDKIAGDALESILLIRPAEGAQIYQRRLYNSISHHALIAPIQGWNYQ